MEKPESDATQGRLLWADGLYVKAGIEDHMACESGERESKEGGPGILRDLISCGLWLPQLTVADGHLGIWSALGDRGSGRHSGFKRRPVDGAFLLGVSMSRRT
jgi:hypothetical protein